MSTYRWLKGFMRYCWMREISRATSRLIGASIEDGNPEMKLVDLTKSK